MKFIALDTETYKGKAFLLSTATEAMPISCFSDFQKILTTFSKDTRFVFYNLDYDVSALVKHLPRRIAAQIYLDRAVKHGSTWLRYLPGKVFSIVTGEGRKLECFDVLPFFQCSLDEAAGKYLGKHKISLADSGVPVTDLSPEIYAANKHLVDTYAIQDSLLLQTLIDNLTISIESTGLKLKALYSPGYLAKCYLKKEKIKIEPCPHTILEDVSKCYHGGRIEVLRRGFFPQVTIYDLKSAYPAAMRTLPDLSLATFSRSKEITGPWDLVRIKTNEIHPAVAPLPLKRNGLLIFPSVDGTLWTTAIEAQQLQNFEILDAINVLVPNDRRPFENLIDYLFAMRKRSGMEGLVYKLILNSLYGVTAEHRKQYKKASLDRVYKKLVKENARAHFETFAQQVARECKNGWKYFDGSCKCDWCKAARYASRQVSKISNEVLLEFEGSFWRTVKDNGAMANKLLATYITAITRVRIYETLSKYPTAIAAFTDSVLLDGEIDFADESGLGSWEKKYSGPCLIIGAGVYETTEETKFRGFRIKRSNPDDRPLQNMLHSMDGTSIGVPQKMRQSFGQSIRTNFDNYTEFNVITDIEKKLDINFDRKRIWARSFDNGADALANQINSVPLSIKTKEGYNEKHYDSLRLRT